MMFAIIIGTLASFWAFLYLLYDAGALAVHGYVVGIGNDCIKWQDLRATRLQRWYHTIRPVRTGVSLTQSMGIGAAMTQVDLARLTCILPTRGSRFGDLSGGPSILDWICDDSEASVWGGLADFWFS